MPAEHPGLSKPETIDLRDIVADSGLPAARHWLLERGFDLDEARSLLPQDGTLDRLISSLARAMAPLKDLFSDETSEDSQVGQAIEETLRHAQPETRDGLANSALTAAMLLDINEWTKENMQQTRYIKHRLGSHIGWWIVQRAARIQLTCPRCSLFRPRCDWAPDIRLPFMQMGRASF